MNKLRSAVLVLPIVGFRYTLASTRCDEDSSRNHSKCLKRLEYAVSRNKRIHQMIKGIESLGCVIPEKSFFACRQCGADISGGFVVPSSSSYSDKQSAVEGPKVVICEDKMLNDKDTFENTIIHELVHAYDVCRTNLDFNNCAQHACTEIRASALSGECALLLEVFRGTAITPRFLHGEGMKDCVRRRAGKSVRMNPNCASSSGSCDVAGLVINSVFDECYGDISPFENDPTFK